MSRILCKILCRILSYYNTYKVIFTVDSYEDIQSVLFFMYSDHSVGNRAVFMKYVFGECSVYEILKQSKLQTFLLWRSAIGQ